MSLLKETTLRPRPDAMTGIRPGTWAHDTITRRWPEILERVYKENTLQSAVVDRLRRIGDDIPDAPIRRIADPDAPDILSWNEMIAPFEGKNWLAPPWFFCEHYFYRRIMAAIGYFGFGRGLDPFAFQKRSGLTAGVETIRTLAALAAPLIHQPPSDDALYRLLYSDLWGNQADYSLWPADGAATPNHEEPLAAEAYLLSDDIRGAASRLVARSTAPGIVDILVDNAGVELAGDLVLADYLLATALTTTVRLHVKPHPTYVSDATAKDVHDTIAFFEAERASDVIRLGRRLSDAVRRSGLVIIDDFFWTSPKPSWEMPVRLRDLLNGSALVISKGDAHYRRLLGDLDWPFETPFEEIVAYFPAPLLALRTLKSELACGLEAGQVAEVTEKDIDWLTNGRWGVAQLFVPKSA